MAVVLVTGCSVGIGYGTALDRFAAVQADFGIYARPAAARLRA